MEKNPATEKSPASGHESSVISTLEAVYRLHAAAGLLASQATLTGRLFWVEWEEEKLRLLNMLIALLLGFAFLLGVMLFTGALLVWLAWDTQYRIAAAIAVIVVYALGLILAWRRFRRLSARGGASFAATRAELTNNISLLTSKL